MESRDEEMYMQATLLELRDKWFDFLDDEHDNPRAWAPSQALRQENQDSKSNFGKEDARAKYQEDVARGAANRLQVLNDDEQLVRQLSQGSKANTLPAGTRKKASRAVSGEDRKKVWEVIKNSQDRALSAYRSSLEIQKELNRVVSSYREQCGESPPPSTSSSSRPAPYPRMNAGPGSAQVKQRNESLHKLFKWKGGGKGQTICGLEDGGRRRNGESPHL